MSVLQSFATLEVSRDLPTIAAIVSTTYFLCCILIAIPRWPKHWDADTRSRITSTVHAIISTGLAMRLAWMVLSSPDFDLWPVTRDGWNSSLGGLLPGGHSSNWDKSKPPAGELSWRADVPAGRFAIAVTLGYILFDSTLLIVFPELFDIPMAIHHGIAISCATLALSMDVGILFNALHLLNEASTPFVNIYQVTRTTWTGLKKTANGLAMWLTYFLFRVVTNTSLAIAMVAAVRTSTIFDDHPWLIVFTLSMSLLLNSLNAIWFYKITMGLVKAVKGMLCPGAAATGSARTSGKSKKNDDHAAAADAAPQAAATKPAPISKPVEAASATPAPASVPTPVVPTPISKLEGAALELTAGVRPTVPAEPSPTASVDTVSTAASASDAQESPASDVASPVSSGSRRGAGVRRRQHVDG